MNENTEEKNDFRDRAKLWSKGHRYDDFEVGQIYHHHWGRTINAGDNSVFTTITLSYNPLYYNEPYAQSMGHPGIVINPLLVFNTVFGLTVEDLSEGGGPFLGVDKLSHKQPVYIGDTLTAESEVVGKRLSEKFEKMGMGIVTWHTKGFNQKNELVIEYQRSNLVRRAK